MDKIDTGKLVGCMDARSFGWDSRLRGNKTRVQCSRMWEVDCERPVRAIERM